MQLLPMPSVNHVGREQYSSFLLPLQSFDARIPRSSPIRVAPQLKKARQERQLPTGRMSD